MFSQKPYLFANKGLHFGVMFFYIGKTADFSCLIIIVGGIKK